MSARGLTKRVSTTPEALTIEWTSGAVDEFASVWLRDNLPEHRDPHSGQRLVDIADLPEHPRIRSAVANDGSIRLEWENEPKAAWFDLDWLASQVKSVTALHPELATRRWLDGAALEASRDFAWASFADAQRDRALRLDWLTRMLQDGVAFLRGVPSTEPAILDAMRLLGRVAETNYGLVFDVRSVPQPENLAYSDLGLGLHTDNPYREPVPGFQALHALIASPDGGHSIFADGFALAEHARSVDRDGFDLLTQTAVPFHYRSKDAELYAERPLIQLSCRGEVTAVHYNSRSIAPLNLAPRDAARFYRAYRRFAALLRDPRYQLKFRLADGELVVFDNQRILHGRTAFSSACHARHLRGCYLTRDSVYSTTAVLRRDLGRESPNDSR
jgi:alpha-ketoglutarate-dependent taurine dioxygenase